MIMIKSSHIYSRQLQGQEEDALLISLYDVILNQYNISHNAPV